MVNTVSTSGHVGYGIKEFMCDTAADVQNLPVDIPAGSTAFVIATSEAYVINSQGSWIKI